MKEDNKTEQYIKISLSGYTGETLVSMIAAALPSVALATLQEWLVSDIGAAVASDFKEIEISTMRDGKAVGKIHRLSTAILDDVRNSANK